MWVLGVGLLRDSGFMNSLATARHTAKVRGSYNIHSSCPQFFHIFVSVYQSVAVTNSIYFLYEVLLANLRGTHDCEHKIYKFPCHIHVSSLCSNNFSKSLFFSFFPFSRKCCCCWVLLGCCLNSSSSW